MIETTELKSSEPNHPFIETSSSKNKTHDVALHLWSLLPSWQELISFFWTPPKVENIEVGLIDLPNELQEMIFSQVPIGLFGSLNQTSSLHIYRQKVPKARLYGYVGNDPEEAKTYITSLFKEVEILAKAKLLPKKYIVYRGFFPFQKVDPANTLKNLKEMTTEEIIHLYNYFNVYSTYLSKPDNTKIVSFQKLAKYLILNNKLEPAKDQVLGKKALLLAAKKNLCSIVELMILLGINFDVEDQDKKNLFFRSVRNGQLEVASLLVKKGADVNKVDTQGRTPLMEATKSPAMMRFLLEKGADAKHRNNKGESALHVAATDGNLEAIKLLLEHGADIDARTNDSLTPLNNATWNGHLEIAQFLIEKGADPNIASSFGVTPLMNAVRKGHPEIVLLLITNQATLNFQNNKGNTALHYASQLGHLEIATTLLNARADPDLRNHLGQSSLAEAIWNKRKDVAKFLIENGADVNTVNGNGNTPLINALRQGLIDLASLIVKTGRLTTIDHRNNAGSSALHFAAEMGQIDIIKLLFTYGVQLNVFDNKHMTPLALAAYKNQCKVVESFIEQGADINTVNLNGNTPLIHATAFPEIIRLLLESGKMTTLDHANNHGYTALHFAAEKSHQKNIELLLSHGADRTLVNRRGKTPQQLAKKSKIKALFD